MGLFTNIIWIIATLAIVGSVAEWVESVYEDEFKNFKSDVPSKILLTVVALLVGTVSYNSYKWVKEEGGVATVLGLVVSKVAKPVSKEVEEFKEGYNEGYNR